MFTIQQVLEKHREYNKETHTCFIDLEKTSDNVNRCKFSKIVP